MMASQITQDYHTTKNTLYQCITLLYVVFNLSKRDPLRLLIRIRKKSRVVAQAYNPNTKETEAEGSPEIPQGYTVRSILEE